jgi:parallel beta-helix repeat protein
MLVSFQRTEMVRASRTIYIRADGSIDPSTAPINRDREIYTLTDHIYDEIVVKRSNVVINGNSFTIQGFGSGRGFNLTSISNVTIKHSSIQNFRIGIHLTSTSHNILCENNMKNNDFAIWLDYSSNNSISENSMKNNDNGFWLSHSLNNTISRNNIKANNCLGIGLACSSDNIISGNKIENNYEGIYLDRSSNNIISRNSIMANDPLGIWHYRSSNNKISENHIENNYMGVYFWHSSSNTISGNNITENNMYGIHFENVSKNMFYHNNFIGNTEHVHIFQSAHTNFWDNGCEGNYWSNYTKVDSDHDGIGDALHEIDANNIDNYPLKGMFHGFNTPYESRVNIISNSSISSFGFGLIEPYQAELIFNVNGEHGTQGFCRICIPKALINGSYIVRFNGNIITYPQVRELPYTNETYEYLYINYTHSQRTIEISGTTTIPELSSFLIMPLFMITTLLAVIFYRRKHSTS